MPAHGTVAWTGQVHGSPLKFHEGPGADRGSSNRCRLACGTAESRRIDFWQSRVKILAEKLGCSRRRRIRTVARITHNCIHRRIATMLGRNCEFPATFGPGQYLPAARATMYGRCLRSAAVSARAVRGMGRRRVGRSTAQTHTGCRSPNSREGWQTRIENSN